MRVAGKCFSGRPDSGYPGDCPGEMPKQWEELLLSGNGGRDQDKDMGNTTENYFPRDRKIPEFFHQKIPETYRRRTPITTSYGEQVANPEDMEIGALVYLAGNGKIPLKSREYETLAVFREARNRLAHLNTLEPDAVDLILRKGNSL